MTGTVIRKDRHNKKSLEVIERDYGATVINQGMQRTIGKDRSQEKSIEPIHSLETPEVINPANVLISDFRSPEM